MMYMKYKREASRHCTAWKCVLMFCMCLPPVSWVLLTWTHHIDPTFMFRHGNQVIFSPAPGDSVRRETELLGTLLNLTHRSKGMDWVRDAVSLKNRENKLTSNPSRDLEMLRFTRKPRVIPRVYQDVVIVTPKPQATTDDKKTEYKGKNSQVTGNELLTAFFEQVIPDFMTGKLNVHVWDRICGPYVEQLRQSPLFPRFPNNRKFVTEFKAEYEGTDFGERIFGYIHSLSAGFYQFAITSDDTSELWLSTDIDPKNARLVATVFSTKGIGWTKAGDLQKYPTQISRRIQLKAGRKYYIEVLHKQGRGKSHLEVLWKTPKHDKFEKIENDFLSLFFDDNEFKTLDESLKESEFELYAPKDVPSHAKRKLDPSLEKSIYKC